MLTILNIRPFPKHASSTLVLLMLVSTLLASVPCNLFAKSAQLTTEPRTPDSQYELAMSFLKKLDYREAVKWFEIAAENGHAKAQYSLALRYLLAQGVEQDFQTAAVWLRKAADQGYADAQFSLGLRYFWGQGTPKDHTQARFWFEKAAQQGQAKAAQFLDKLGAAQPTPQPLQISQKSTEDLIADYAQLIYNRANADEKMLALKSQLEEILTPKEVMLGIQRASQQRLQNSNRPDRQQLMATLKTLFESLKTPKDYFIAGNDLVREGKLEAAIAVYEESLKTAPNASSTLRNLASTYAHLGQSQKAIENLRKSIALSPGQASKHATLGLVLQTTGNIEAALSEYRQAAKLNPALGWFYPDMAEIFIIQKKYADAWKAVLQAEHLGYSKERVRARLVKNVPEPKDEPALTSLLLRQLVLPTREEAENVLNALQNGDKFDRLVEQFAIRDFRDNGGYWGPYQPEQLAPQFRTAMELMPPLVISPIIETAVGFHIMQKFVFYDDLANND